MKKLAYSLIVSTCKLKAYFESHPIVIYTNAPLTQIFHKIWSIELCGLDITFLPRATIKAQALAYFFVENSFNEETRDEIVNISMEEEFNS